MARKSAPPAYPSIGGVHSDSTLLARALAAKGLINPLTRQPFSEALIFGIAGGLGGMYFVWEMCGMVILTVGGRWWCHDNVKFLQGGADRLGVGLHLSQPGGRKAAQAALDQGLATGGPVFCWTDQASLPYHHLPETYRKFLIHTIAVTDQDSDGSYLVDDRGEGLYRISADDLAAARQTQPYMKARLGTLSLPDQPVDVRDAVYAGMRAMAKEGLHPEIRNFGVPAFEKWAELIIHPKDKKGWPTVMATDIALWSALCWTYASIATDTGGGLMRPLYATFLTEAGKQLKDKALVSCADEALALGARWDRIADLALPAGKAPFKQARSLLDKREAARHQGPAGEKALAKAEADLTTLQQQAPSFPAGYRETLFPAMHAELAAVAAAERAFMERMADLAG